MRTQGNTRWTVGSIHPKPRDSLAYLHAKGYRPTWAVDQATDGLKEMGGREKEALAAGTVTATAAQPWPAARTRRSARFGGHGPRFDEP